LLPFLSGIPELDVLLGEGLQRGRLALLAGATESGKTSLALQVALACAAQGARVVYCSLKDNGVEASGRGAAQEMKTTPEQGRELLFASPSVEFSLAPLYFATVAPAGTEQHGLHTLADSSITTISKLAQELIATVVIVDDLASVTGEGYTAEPALSSARALAQLARVHDWLVIALDDGHGGYEPGLPAPAPPAIEAYDDCALVLFLSRPAHLHGWPPGMGQGLKGVIGVEVVKNESGPRTIGQIWLDSNGVISERRL
jgi:hypothetical protein